MIGAVLVALAVGIGIGILVGRRMGPPAEKPAPPKVPPAIPKRAAKAGITEESFTPSDDILEKMRLVAEGKLDPSVLAAEGASSPEPPPPEPDQRLSEAERRVLDRLRSQRPEPD